MEPELKTYLEGMESRLQDEIHEVARTTATILDTMENNHQEIMDAHMQRINGAENRINRVEEKVRIIETKIA